MGLCNATQNISRKQKLNFCDTQQLKVFGFVHQTYNEHIPQDILLLIVDYAMQIPIDSTILNEEEQEYLHKLIISQPQTMQFECSEWNLLCRGSRDGIKQKVFHGACDGKRNTICLLDVDSSGVVCGGYASTAWKSATNNTKGKDDNAFLFVVRPIELRNVYHRKRNKDTNKLMEPNGGILFHQDDGFNFGYNTLFWGNWAEDPKYVYCKDSQNYFDYKYSADIVGNGPGHSKEEFIDFEVFQLLG
eukprot:223522_1